MAFIKTQNGQYELPFRNLGLVETDSVLYNEIASICEKNFSHILNAINRNEINSAVEIIKFKKGLNSLEMFIKFKRKIKLGLFIRDIIISDDMAYANISLGLPWYGKEEHHTWVLEEILRQYLNKDVYVSNGNINMIVLFENIFPREIKKNGSGQRRFVAKNI